MRSILHDISVAWWALRTNHRDRKDFRIAVRWPISIHRAKPFFAGEWLLMVSVRSPRLYIINADTVESDYRAIHRSSTI